MPVIIDDMEVVLETPQDQTEQTDDAGRAAATQPANARMAPYEMARVLRQQMARYDRVRAH